MVKYIRNNKTISGKLHDEMVMMDIDQGKYFSLNPAATRIWDMLEKQMSADELCELLIEEYDVEMEHCRSEVTEYLSEMAKLGLIVEVA